MCCNYWSPHALSPCSSTREATTMRSLCTATKTQCNQKKKRQRNKALIVEFQTSAEDLSTSSEITSCLQLEELYTTGLLGTVLIYTYYPCIFINQCSLSLSKYLDDKLVTLFITLSLPKIWRIGARQNLLKVTSLSWPPLIISKPFPPFSNFILKLESTRKQMTACGVLLFFSKWLNNVISLGPWIKS